MFKRVQRSGDFAQMLEFIFLIFSFLRSIKIKFNRTAECWSVNSYLEFYSLWYFVFLKLELFGFQFAFFSSENAFLVLNLCTRCLVKYENVNSNFSKGVHLRVNYFVYLSQQILSLAFFVFLSNHGSLFPSQN